MILVARTASCRVTNAFFHQTEANLATIQLQHHQNVEKKKILAKSSRCQWVNMMLQEYVVVICISIIVEYW